MIRTKNGYEPAKLSRPPIYVLCLRKKRQFMDILQQNIMILFRHIQPEMLYQSICCDNSQTSAHSQISVSNIGLEAFQGLAFSEYPSYSYEEISGIHQLLTSQMQPVLPYVTSATSIFHLLVRMGQRVLQENEHGLVCIFSELLTWQNIYQNLGQDLFTTAFLSYEDIRRGVLPRQEFLWPPVLQSDNIRLRMILQKGVAENHCHLGGSSQNFALSWACLMNCPFTIQLASSQIRQNLQIHLSRGIIGNVWPWKKRLEWAAYLRLELFKRLEGISRPDDSLHMERHCFHPALHIQQELRYLKSCYAAVSQECPFPLDYALRKADCKNGLLEKHRRLLSGERSFLYRCFRACFDGTFCEATQNWFYLYLLIKENFRAEMVQVNQQAGFHNFMDYQDRKDCIYDHIPAYHAEAVRLAVNANLQDQNITSFEVRLAPKSSSEELLRQVKNYDHLIRKGRNSQESNKLFYTCHDGENSQELNNLFYVYHFIKKPDLERISNSFLVPPRNDAVRKDIQKKAKALHYALQHNRYFCERVCGIDAANTEIHCRPEVFAPAFRYLKDISSLRRSENITSYFPHPHIHATYHAGEDFLDIADGLRAIDEAVKFLHLERGDRIGHALAMGIEPESHYSFKNWRVVLPKQDLLDNTTWLLYRSQTVDTDLSPQLRFTLQTQAERLLQEIYGNSLQFDFAHIGLYEYYCSMQLRSDSPELYLSSLYEEPAHLLCGMYNQYIKDTRPELEPYRKSRSITFLNQLYHFNRQVRNEGKQMIEVPISTKYMELIYQIQNGLSNELAARGIAIECNPTSNYLIGTFRSYDSHPIFRFNNERLVRIDGTFESSAQLSVSINTDDLGVFDTSLENEYAIIAASLDRLRCEDRKRYTEDSIYCYLEHIRKMGLEQSFKRSK